MSTSVKVGLLSGKTATLKAHLEDSVGASKSRAQTALGVGSGRLLDSSGNTLDVRALMKTVSMQTDDALILHMSRVQACGTNAAFAAILGDGPAVASGHACYGGNSRAVQDQLRNVKQIQSSISGAFAAVLCNRSVVTWGAADSGGDSSAVQSSLRNVQQIQAGYCAFAAVLGGRWIRRDLGRCSLWCCRAVQDELRNV